MNGNNIVNISISNAQQATSHYPDSDLPVLVSYTLDLNTGILALTYSETVNVSTLNPNLFFIQSSPAAASVSEYYQLNDSTTSSSTEVADTVQILLGVMDLNNIKANTLIATSSSTTYLRFLPGAVYDQSGNSAEGLSNGNAVQVAAYNAGRYVLTLVVWTTTCCSEHTACCCHSYISCTSYTNTSLFVLIVL